MDAARYLERLGGQPAGPPTLDTLAALQRAHLLRVPFENLSIVAGEEISLGAGALYRKVVDRRRGGFCYELNGAFYALLDGLGFEVRRGSGRVVGDDGDLGPEADHMCLVVTLPDGEYLVDVGYGDFARVPLPLTGDPRTDPGGEWRVRPVDPERDERAATVGGTYVAESRDGEEWTLEYVFDDTHHETGHYRETCRYHQTSPESPFTGEPFVTMATPEGRKTLSAETLTVTSNGRKEKRGVAADEWLAVLEREFGVENPPDGVASAVRSARQ